MCTRQSSLPDSHGLCRPQVEDSGWTPPTPLDRADLLNPNTRSEEYRQNQIFLVRARVEASETVYEITGRLELVGGIFSRTLVRHICNCAA